MGWKAAASRSRLRAPVWWEGSSPRVRGKAASLPVQVRVEEEVGGRRREEEEGSSMAAGHGMAWTSEESGSMIAAEAFGTMLARGSMPGPASCAHSTLSAAAGAVAAEAERSGLAAALDRGCGRGGGGGGGGGRPAFRSGGVAAAATFEGGGGSSSSSSSSVGRRRWKGFEGMVAASLLIAVAASTLGMANGGQVIEIGDEGSRFFMNQTHPFHPSKSLSFAHVLFVGFSLTYADTSGLKGYIAQDVVQVGRYYAKTKFGCITHCDSADFNGIDGILGLGMPDAALASIPEPLFFALSDETGDPANQYILRRRIFTIVSTDGAAELHLGGYDPHSFTGDMQYVKTTSTTEYSVPVTSLSFDGHELLNFDTAAQAKGQTSIPGILDSGTSCLVLPDSTLKGLFTTSPYTRLMNVIKRDEPFYMSVEGGGHRLEIPFKHWWLGPNDRPCIQTAPDGFQGMLLGDVVFRSLVVMFDLSHPMQPVIGLAPRNPMYNLVDAACSHVNDYKGCVAEPAGPAGVTKMRMGKRKVKSVNKYLARATAQLNWVEKRAMHHANGGAGGHDDGDVPALDPSGGDLLLTKVPVDFYEETQFFVNVSVGTPRQTRTVILDTGSSVFGIFCDAPPKGGKAGAEGGHRGHIYLPHFIPSSGSLLQVMAGARGVGEGEGWAVWDIAGCLCGALFVLLAVRRARARGAGREMCEREGDEPWGGV